MTPLFYIPLSVAIQLFLGFSGNDWETESFWRELHLSWLPKHITFMAIYAFSTYFPFSRIYFLEEGTLKRIM